MSSPNDEWLIKIILPSVVTKNIVRVLITFDIRRL